MVAGLRDVGKGSAARLRQAGCRVMVSEAIDRARWQAAMEGYGGRAMGIAQREPKSS